MLGGGLLLIVLEIFVCGIMLINFFFNQILFYYILINLLNNALFRTITKRSLGSHLLYEEASLTLNEQANRGYVYSQISWCLHFKTTQHLVWETRLHFFYYNHFHYEVPFGLSRSALLPLFYILMFFRQCGS